jgi:hypothetical protein
MLALGDGPARIINNAPNRGINILVPGKGHSQLNNTVLARIRKIPSSVMLDESQRIFLQSLHSWRQKSAQAAERKFIKPQRRKKEGCITVNPGCYLAGIQADTKRQQQGDYHTARAAEPMRCEEHERICNIKLFLDTQRPGM